MFIWVLPFLLFSTSAFAQAVDFDREFPLSDADLYYPIGKNGELPSEGQASVNPSSTMPDYMQNIETGFDDSVEDSSERFVNENAEVIYTNDETAKIYAEPTTLGFQPRQIAEEEASVRVEPLAKTAQTFSINELPTTTGSSQPKIPASPEVEAKLNEMEQAVTKMEQSIESIINKANQDTGNTTARPLVEFPELVERTGADISAIGIMTQTQNGFPKNVWANTTLEQAQLFFDKVNKSEIKSPAVKRKLVELLLTKADMPMASEGSKNWLAMRVELLHNLGETYNAGLLLSSAGVDASNVNLYKGIAKPWAENMLMQGRVDEVCGFIKQNILNSDDTFWRKALLTCQLLNRDIKGLELSTNMLSQSQRKEDPLLFSLFDIILSESGTPYLKPHQKLSPLHVVVFSQSPRLLTPNVVPLMPDVMLRKVAKNMALPESVRIQAAETLVNNFDNKDDIALLGLLYSKVEFDEKIVSSPGVDRYAEEEVDGSIARALLWQGSGVTGLSSTRALTLKAFWERAERDYLYNLSAKITPAFRKISPNANLAWLSPEVVSRSLRNGNVDVALKWWEPLKSNKSLSRDLSAKRDSLKIAMAFVEGNLPLSDFNAWLGEKSLYDDEVRTSVQRLLSYLEASEISFPDDVWQKLYASSDGKFIEKNSDMNTLWLRLLGSQLEKQNTAGAFMLLVEPFLKDKMSELSEQTATNVVTGFKFLGMDHIARDLILEDILDTGESSD